MAASRFGHDRARRRASLLGFDRPAPLDEREADAVIADLATLYGSGDSEHWGELRSILVSRRILLLGYTEDFSENAGS